jgi:hypothetical protein
MATKNTNGCPVNGLAKHIDGLMIDFVRPDQPSKCTWTQNSALTNVVTPHSLKERWVVVNIFTYYFVLSIIIKQI